jgi:hypothetical protein
MMKHGTGDLRNPSTAPAVKYLVIVMAIQIDGIFTVDIVFYRFLTRSYMGGERLTTGHHPYPALNE